MKIAGIDEAGKGPVIGPLVVCGYAINEEKLEKLRELSVKDSKKLSPKKRESIAEKLMEIGECELIVIHPERLNDMMCRTTINEILFTSYEEIIERLNPDICYVDSPDVKPERLEKRLSKGGLKVIARHKADERYEIVASASIIAKVVRDREIEKLKKIYGDFGSGYSSDPRTIDFLTKYLKKNGEFPDCVRKKWKTLSKIRGSQKSIDDFI